MIFIFAPALGSLVLILAIILREQFTFRRSVPMLDQIHMEFWSPEKLEAKLRISGRESISDCAERGSRPRKLIWGIEVGTVESVIHLRPELQASYVSEVPVLLNREIPVLVPGRTES